MKTGKHRTKGFFMRLHPDEYEFLKKYAKKNYLNVAEIIRRLLHELMKREGVPLGDLTLSKEKPTIGRK